MKEKDFNKDVGEHLRELRTKKNLSLLEIANRLKVGKTTVHYWETGRNAISAISLKEYCDILDISLTDFFKGI